MANNVHQLSALAEQFATPLYVFDEAELARRIAFVQQNMPENVKLCYAVKANPFILKKASELVDRIEVCSTGEHAICQAVGVPANKLVISGVHKDERVITEALQQDGPAARYTIESREQLDLLQRVAHTTGAQLNVLVRLSSGNQFGVDAQTVLDMAPTLASDESLTFCGLQYFSGTQKKSVAKLQKELARVQDLTNQLASTYGLVATEIEYGGGFAVDYFSGQTLEERYASDRAFLQEFSEAFADQGITLPLHLELGRFLAASCGTYLTRVVDTKCTDGERFAIMDGGIHQITYYGNALALKQPPCQLLSADHAGAFASEGGCQLEWTLCGSLCTVNDLLAKRMPFAGLEQGSVVAFHLAGAYCMTEGLSLFLSRDLPAVVLTSEQGAQLVREHTQTNPLNTP